MAVFQRSRAYWLHEIKTALPAVVEARRGQVLVRTALCAAVAVCFHALAGTFATILWGISYIGIQLFEMAYFRKVGRSTRLTPIGSVVLLAIMLLSATVYTLLGIVVTIQSGVFGLVCAVVYWSGSILNAAMVSGESKAALSAAIFPPLFAFLTLPWLVVWCGGTQIVALQICAAGLMNVATVIVIWSGTRRLLLATTRATETARLALLDSETGLPNRHQMMFRVASMRENSDAITFVAAIGLDRFDSLSNAIGNALTVDLIHEVVSRLGAACPELTFARLSTSMLGTAWSAETADDARHKMLALHHAMKAAIVLRGTPIDINITIGLSQDSDRSGTSEIAIIDRAVIAIAQARRAHQPIFHFDADLLGDPGRALSLMGEMLEALDRDTMDVHYQPKQDLRTGKMIGVEALVRWTHPQLGPLPPDSFLPMAEETGRVAALTEWVLKRAIKDQRQLAEHGHTLSFSVNLSGALLDDEDFARILLGITSQAAGKIIFEVTETAVMSNAVVACRILAAFRSAGIGISIDDYGTGMSSLGYLKNIPADELKIDKVFVLKVAENDIDAIIVRSAVDLAHSLGLIVVAEGIETQNALDLLKAVNCDLAQGYFIARPISLSQLEVMLGVLAPGSGPAWSAGGSTSIRAA